MKKRFWGIWHRVAIDVDKAIAYVKKEETKMEEPHEWGEPPKQGERTDLSAIGAMIVSGMAVDDIALEHPAHYIRYNKGMNALEDIMLRKKWRTWMTLGLWYHGPTYTGKSERCFFGYHPDNCFLWKNDRGWWDGYTGQKIVIMNDFRGEVPYNEMLQIIDKWPYSVSRRGRAPAPFLAEKVIITSSLPPDQVYKNREAEDKIEQLLRRVEVVFTGVKTKVEEEVMEMTFDIDGNEIAVHKKVRLP